MDTITSKGMTFYHSGEEPIIGHGPTAPIEAQVAKHDYAHEGCYVRLVDEVLDDGVTRRWHLYIAPGRLTRPTCCRPKSRTYVDEEPPEETWQPRGGRERLRLIS